MPTPSARFSGWHEDKDNARLDFYYKGTRIGHISATGMYVAGTALTTNAILDGVLLTLGTDADVALVNRATILNANTTLTGVIVGTPVTPAVAANSLILGNVTADGDIMVATQTGGNSHAAMWVDASAAITRFYAGAGVEVLQLASAVAQVTGQLYLGAAADGSTPGVSVAAFKVGTPPVGAATTTSKIYASATVMRKIIADGTDSAIG